VTAHQPLLVLLLCCYQTDCSAHSPLPALHCHHWTAHCPNRQNRFWMQLLCLWPIVCVSWLAQLLKAHQAFVRCQQGLQQVLLRLLLQLPLKMLTQLLGERFCFACLSW
jgi:hypothetical protein